MSTQLYSAPLNNERARSAIERGLVSSAAAALREAAGMYTHAARQDSDEVTREYRARGDQAMAIGRECVRLVTMCSVKRIPPTRDERLEWLAQVKALREQLLAMQGFARRRDCCPAHYVKALLHFLTKVVQLDWDDDAVWLSRLPRRDADSF